MAQKFTDLGLNLRRDIDPNDLYELIALLGEGSYGAVYKGIIKDLEDDGEGEQVVTSANSVAIKIIPDADDDLTSLSREIKFLQVCL
jgi:serine/threonine protein kinase